MSEAVIDTSVFLALLQEEPISPVAAAALINGVMSAVNVAEVYSKLARRGVPETTQVRMLFASLGRIAPFTAAQARVAGDMLPQTSKVGLSLGDRACLALALELNAEVFTTDRAWANIPVGCKVNVLR